MIGRRHLSSPQIAQKFAEIFEAGQDVKKCAIDQKLTMFFRPITETPYKNLAAKNKA